jgi:hypothetical protein
MTFHPKCCIRFSGASLFVADSRLVRYAKMDGNFLNGFDLRKVLIIMPAIILK